MFNPLENLMRQRDLQHQVFAQFGIMMVGLAAILVVGLQYVSKQVPVDILGFARAVGTSGWDKGRVDARGTWIIEGAAPIAAPLNVSKISCVRNAGNCYEAKAEWSDRVLNANLETYVIRRWDSVTIEYAHDTADCATYYYVIDRSTEKVAGRRTKKASTNKRCDSLISEPEVRLSLVSGFDVARRLKREHIPYWPMAAAAVPWTLMMFLRIALVVRRFHREGLRW